MVKPNKVKDSDAADEEVAGKEGKDGKEEADKEEEEEPSKGPFAARPTTYCPPRHVIQRIFPTLVSCLGSLACT